MEAAIAGSYQALSEAERQALRRLLATQPCEGPVGTSVRGAARRVAGRGRRDHRRARLARTAPGARRRGGSGSTTSSGPSPRPSPGRTRRRRATRRCAGSARTCSRRRGRRPGRSAADRARSRTPGRRVIAVSGAEGSAWLRGELGRLVAVSGPWPRGPGLRRRSRGGRGALRARTDLAAVRQGVLRGGREAAAQTDDLGTGGGRAFLPGARCSRPRAIPARWSSCGSSATTPGGGHRRLDLSAMNDIGVSRPGEATWGWRGRCSSGGSRLRGRTRRRPRARRRARQRRHRAASLGRSRGGGRGAPYGHPGRLGVRRRSRARHRAGSREPGGPAARPRRSRRRGDGRAGGPRALAEGRSQRIALQASTALALARFARGDAVGALAALREVQRHEEQIADPSQRANFHIALGDVLLATGEEADAVAHKGARWTWPPAPRSPTSRLVRRCAWPAAPRRPTSSAPATGEGAVELFAQSRAGPEPDATVAELADL